MDLNSFVSSPNFGGFAFGLTGFLSSSFLALGSMGTCFFSSTNDYFSSFFLSSLSSLISLSIYARFNP